MTNPMNLQVDVKLLDPRLRDIPPHYATAGSAGLDLRACIEAALEIRPGETLLIPDRHRHSPRRSGPRRDDPATLGPRATNTASSSAIWSG
jgi:hypothetical protein